MAIDFLKILGHIGNRGNQYNGNFLGSSPNYGVGDWKKESLRFLPHYLLPKFSLCFVLKTMVDEVALKGDFRP